MAYANEKFGPASIGMRRTYIQYGAPDQIDDRGSDPQHPSQIWRYAYLEDFRSNVEFEFPQGSPGARINWPPPSATYQGEGGSTGPLLDELSREIQRRGETATAPATSGLPGKHASILVYPMIDGTILSVPLDSLAGRVDLIAQVRTHPSPEEPGQVAANLRDVLQAAAGTYQAHFSLPAGSYVCRLLVREASGQMYTEAIQFAVK